MRPGLKPRSAFLLYQAGSSADLLHLLAEPDLLFMPVTGSVPQGEPPRTSVSGS